MESVVKQSSSSIIRFLYRQINDLIHVKYSKKFLFWGTQVIVAKRKPLSPISCHLYVMELYLH